MLKFINNNQENKDFDYTDDIISFVPMGPKGTHRSLRIGLASCFEGNGWSGHVNCMRYDVGLTDCDLKNENMLQHKIESSRSAQQLSEFSRDVQR